MLRVLSYLKKDRYLAVYTCAVLLCLAGAAAQTADPDTAAIEIVQLTDNLHVLQGMGGNIAVSSGPDGVFVVDDELKPLTPKVMAALRSITEEPVKIVFNTHWHADHTGGNEFFGDAGALIVAHDNVRERMATSQFSKFFGTTTQPAPAAALPVVTYSNTATFHLNGQTIRAIHMPPAHTDGDSILRFEEANVVHLGDVFFNGRFPLLDLGSQGSVRGIIAAVDQILPTIDDETRVIPGHGPIGDKADLEAYRSMLVVVTTRIDALITEGKSRDEVIALRPSINFDADWAWELLPPERWVGLIYDSLSAQDGTTNQVGDANN